jgi:hypothetical protein
MKLIESKTLGTAQAAIEFTSIPQTYTDLVLTISARSAASGARNDIQITINSDTGSNYSGRRLIGVDGVTQSYAASGSPFGSQMVAIVGNGATANTFANGSIYFPNYTSTTNKSFSVDMAAENNSSGDYILGITAYLYTTSSAITAIKIQPDGHNLVAGTTMSLYGVLKGSDGIVTTS